MTFRFEKLRKKAYFWLLLPLSLSAVFHFAPLPNDLKNKPHAKILLAADGSLLAARIASDQQWRFPATKTLPHKYLQALIEFEDKHFFKHPGVNPVAIFRALKNNIQQGRVTSGGSTITMQLARLARNNPTRSYKNKFIEILIAFKLEWHFSKQEILSLYAANAPFGGNTVGLSAASWRYFKHSLHGKMQKSTFTWAEAALLAVLPNSPALMHPGRNREQLKNKRDRLLKRLLSKGLLTSNEYKLSLLEPLPSKPQALPRLAPQLLTTLISLYPDKQIFHTTLDASLQKQLYSLSKRYSKQLYNQGVQNSAVVVIDNQTLTTSAYIGNSTVTSRTRKYARDLDIARRPRSTGSILKPLLYGLMLQEGKILPETLIPDVPINYSGFTPENYDRQYRGAVQAKQALAQSLNIPSVIMLKSYGIAKFYSHLNSLGMSTLFRTPDEYGLSLILGGAEGNLWELTSINALLVKTAQQGRDSLPHKNIKVLQSEKPIDHSFPLGQGASWLILEALRETTRPGNESIWKEFASSQIIAWKTGTSYGLRDAWAIGNSKGYSVGVWTGNASGEGIAGMSGLKTAAPLLFKVYDLLSKSSWLEIPEAAIKTLNICKDNGYLATAGCQQASTYAPVNSHFQQVSPHHKTIKLDKTKQFRVHGGCESVSNMEEETRLILPPLQEYYWKQAHNSYQSLPPWRQDCISTLANYTDDVPMEIAYPEEGGKIYIPRELSGKKGRVVFKASHRNNNETLYWHIDDTFIQSTKYFHDISIDLSHGWHQLIIVDESGYRLKRRFRVLQKARTAKK